MNRKDQGNYRNVAGVFILAIVIFDIVFQTVIGLMSMFGGYELKANELWFVMNGLVFAICLAFMVLSRQGFSEFFGFKRIKISSFLLTILFGFLIYPFTSIVAEFSNLLFGNPLTEVVDETGAGIFLIMSVVIAPFIEEFVFRGIFYRGLRRRGRIAEPVLISALMFGLYHGNITQFIYASVLGIFLALAVDASGSVWSSVTIHLLFNAIGTGLAYIAALIPESEAGANAADTDISAMSFLSGSLIALGFAVFLLWLGLKVLKVISRKEKREDIYLRKFQVNAGSGFAVYIFVLIAAILLAGALGLDLLAGVLPDVA